MAALDRLAPDQRAALMLILQQGQSYDDLAELLATDAAAIRARAHAAVDVVAAEVAGELDPVQRGEITDYMLGQQSHSQREAMRGLLAESPRARAFARAVTQELAPLMPDEPPGVPGAGSPAAPVEWSPDTDPAAAIATTAADLPASRRREEPARAERAEPADSTPSRDRPSVRASAPGGGHPDSARAPAPPRSATERRAARAAAASARGPAPVGAAAASMAEPASGLADGAAWAPAKDPSRPANTRLGGLILILIAAAALVAGIVLFASSSGSSTTSTPSAGSAPSGAAPTGSGATGTSGPQGASRVQVLANVPLSAADGSRARGQAEVVQQQGTSTRAFLIAGTGLAPSSSSSAYAVWLYNTPSDAVSLGFFSQAVGRKGQLEGTAAVPANVSRYTQIIITRETTSRPVRPGPIVMRGALKLPAG